MDKKALYNLLGKYLNNTCSQEERDLVDHWLDLLQEDKSFAAYTQKDLNVIGDRIWLKIQAQTFQNNEAEKPAANRRRLIITLSRWAVAASVVAVISFTAYQFAKRNSTSNGQDNFASIIPASGMVKEENTTSKSIRKMLEDSSVVVLEPGTVLNYPVHFAQGKREVYLQGKAFFQVSKNAKRPFYIYHNNLVTHVIGTSFIINTLRQNKEAEVLVITGRVEVSENARLVAKPTQAKIKGVILTPNQKVVYVSDSRSFVSSIVERPVPVKNDHNADFDFNNVEISQVLAAISKEYGIEIITENDNINKCTFTGDIAIPELYTKLDIVCKAINASYEIKETKILVKGKGCD